jgi:pyroglutamyl-peptidase
MAKVLITGFSPFQGRELNASWIAATLLKEIKPLDPICAIEIPVVWDMPFKLLQRAINEHQPEVVIAMGEGKPGSVQLETLAINKRTLKHDNENHYSDKPYIIENGPEQFKSSAPLVEIRDELIAQGIPTLLSLGAGGYLCEEAFYVLEYYKQRSSGLSKVIFVHLPPFGTKLRFKGKEQTCDRKFLADFVAGFYEMFV